MSERRRWVLVFAVLTLLGLIGVAIRTSDDADTEETGVPRIQDTVGVPLDPDPDPDPPSGFLPGPATSDETPD